MPLVTQVKLDAPAQDRAETLGTPLPQTEVMIADVATGQPVPVGRPGELCARGYLVMRGYHDAPEATAAAIDAGGWYHVRAVPGHPAPAPQELHAWCRARLAPYKTPAHWVFTDAFPMTPSGKIQKFKLRESFSASQPG